MSNTQIETPAETSRGLALGSLAAGILGLVTLLVFFVAPVGMAVLITSAVLGIVALVLGILALKRNQPRSFAITGIVTGAISIVIGLGLIFFALAFIGALFGEPM